MNIFKHHVGRIGALAWNGSSFLSSGSMDTLIVNNDIRMPNPLVSKYKCHTQEVCGLKWSPDGTQLASGGNDNLLCLWDINNVGNGNHQGPNAILRDHSAAVKALAWCPWQRNLLASGGGS